jgi:hypothetical protein
MAQTLSNFIKGTLAEISEGIRASRETGLVVAPGRTSFPDGERMENPALIRFEVEVSSDHSGKAGISVLSMADIGGTTGHRRGHKISFEVPVYFWAEWKDKDHA